MLALPMIKPAALLTLLMPGLILSGCSSLLPSPDADKPAAESIDSPKVAEQRIDEEDTSEVSPPPPRPFEPDTLFNLLVGELAIVEQDLGRGVKLYSQEAKSSQDRGVAERAALLARYYRDSETALEMAQLWHELSPNSAKAVENYADILTRTNQPLKALDILESAFTPVPGVNFEVLRNGRLSPDQRTQILQRLEHLNTQPHSNESLVFTYTLLLQASERNEEALAQVSRLRDMIDNSLKLAQLEATLLSQLDRDSDAAKVLEKELSNNPNNRRLHLQYARSLAKFDMPAAEKEFSRLLESTPHDVKLLMAHALAAIENKHFDAARTSLNQLLAMHRSYDFANYHLGEIASVEADDEKAIAQYQKVQLGDYFGAATEAILEIHQKNGQDAQAIAYLELLREQFPQHAARLWSFQSIYYRKSDNLNAAYDALSAGIEEIPDSSELRIERSYISDMLDNLDLAENDLRWVIAQEPNNASALNALGYMLTIKTDRYTEALDLIEKAIILQPDDPAIRDSLGWVYYKLGRHDEAETELVRAFQGYPDDEIAAHLIELYWQTNQKKKARELYRSLQKNNGEFPKVEETLKKLAIRW